MCFEVKNCTKGSIMACHGTDKTVYLDYNATTPLAAEVLEGITSALRDAWANPSSGHYAGIKARKVIISARQHVADMIDGKAEDIIFTSGGTESNNMVFQSLLRHYSLHHSDGTLPHVVISNLEHDSIDFTIKELVARGQMEATVVKCNPSTGAIEPDAIQQALCSNTVLVSVMLANNETGVIQPVKEIVDCVRRWEEERGDGHRVFVHTDAAQALGKIKVSAKELGVDYLTIVGHKFYGPRIGALWVMELENKATPIYPMLFGGGQERGLRSGTENTGMIAGLGEAARLVVDNIDKYNTTMKEVRDYLESRLLDVFGERVSFNGRFSSTQRIPNTSNVSVRGENLKGNLVLSKLERSLASVGAACHSHTVSKPSSILLACGVPEAVAVNALRLSVGRETTKADIDVFIADLKNAISLLEHT